MKLLAMNKVDAKLEAGVMPSAEDAQRVGGFLHALHGKGVFLDGEGLKASATRARVSVKGAERRVERGPYAGRNELIAGVCLLTAKTLDDAIGWGARIAEALGDGAEVEVSPLIEPWDMGAPRPEPMPALRFLALAKSDAKAEAGVPFLTRIAAVADAMKRAGVLTEANGLAPSQDAKRVKQQRDRRTILDGPFTESKELIAGYCVLQVATWDEAIAFAEGFAKAYGSDVEMDLRPIA